MKCSDDDRANVTKLSDRAQVCTTKILEMSNTTGEKLGNVTKLSVEILADASNLSDEDFVNVTKVSETVSTFDFY